MKCQSLFSAKYKKTVINLLHAEFAPRVAKLKVMSYVRSILQKYHSFSTYAGPLSSLAEVFFSGLMLT